MSQFRLVSAVKLGAPLAAFAIFSACGQQMDHGSTGGSMSGMEMGGTSRSMRATLAPSNGVAGAGNATVAVVKGQVHVDVRVQHLTATGAYVVHLHRGSCAASGEVVKNVGDLTADAAGAGGAHSEYAGNDLPTPGFVEVHSATGDQGPAVICGDLH